MLKVLHKSIGNLLEVKRRIITELTKNDVSWTDIVHISKIDAVKMYANANNCGLKEAKEAVEKHMEDFGIKNC